MSQRALPQSKEALLKSYNKKLKDDIKSMLDNFTEIIKLARVNKVLCELLYLQFQYPCMLVHVKTASV